MALAVARPWARDPHPRLVPAELGRAAEVDAAVDVLCVAARADPGGVGAGGERHLHEQLLALLGQHRPPVRAVHGAGVLGVEVDRGSGDAAEGLERHPAVVAPPPFVAADVAEVEVVALVHAHVDRVVGVDLLGVPAERRVERPRAEPHGHLPVRELSQRLEVHHRGGRLAAGWIGQHDSLHPHRYDLAAGRGRRSAAVREADVPEHAVGAVGLDDVRGRGQIAPVDEHLGLGRGDQHQACNGGQTGKYAA